MYKNIFFVALLLGCAACRPARLPDPAYVAEHEVWQQERLEALKSPNGWLALTGLYWLKPGANTFGSDSSNAIVFPGKAPGQMGVFYLEGDSVRMEIAAGVEVTQDSLGSPVTRSVLRLEQGIPPAVLHWKSLDWVLLERGGRYGIRLWDRENPAITALESIPAFPLDPSWQVEARLIPADSGRIVAMQNILGMTIEQASAGILEFEKGGKTYQLEALEDPNGFFLIFADATTGESTYSGGRYLYVPHARPDGKTRIDFNRAENPPCVFTKYATCLLPPAQNRLNIEVPAGERAPSK